MKMSLEARRDLSDPMGRGAVRHQLRYPPQDINHIFHIVMTNIVTYQQPSYRV